MLAMRRSMSKHLQGTTAGSDIQPCYLGCEALRSPNTSPVVFRWPRSKRTCCLCRHRAHSRGKGLRLFQKLPGSRDAIYAGRPSTFTRPSASPKTLRLWYVDAHHRHRYQPERVLRLCEQGLSYRKIEGRMSLGVGTVARTIRERSALCDASRNAESGRYAELDASTDAGTGNRPLNAEKPPGRV